MTPCGWTGPSCQLAAGEATTFVGPASERSGHRDRVSLPCSPSSPGHSCQACWAPSAAPARCQVHWVPAGCVHRAFPPLLAWPAQQNSPSSRGTGRACYSDSTRQASKRDIIRIKRVVLTQCHFYPLLFLLQQCAASSDLFMDSFYRTSVMKFWGSWWIWGSGQAG